MKKIGEAYLDQGRMWQNVIFESGDDMADSQVKLENEWMDDTGNWGRKYSGAPSIYDRRIPVENKVQENAKKNLPLLKKMLLDRVRILKRVGNNLCYVSSPTALLKDGEFFSLDNENYSSLQPDQIGQEKYAIFEALAEGKQVQFKHYESDTQWHDFTPFNINCHFDAMNRLYRVKPEIPADTVIKWRSPSENPDSSERQIILHYPDGSMNIVYDTKGYTYHDGWAYV